MVNKKLQADFMLLLVAVVWGSSFILIQDALVYISAFSYLTIRYAIGAFLLICTFPKHLTKINLTIVKSSFYMAVILVISMALQVVGLYYTSASAAAFITGLNAVIVPPLSALILKIRPNRWAISGVIIAFLGMCVFQIDEGLNFRLNIGDLMMLGSAFGFAFYIILVDRFAKMMSPKILSIVQIFFAAILFAIIWGIFDRKPLIFNTTVIVVLFVTGFLNTAFAGVVQTVFQKNTTPTHAALIFAVEPIFGLIFALFIPDPTGNVQTLTFSLVVGCILILGGMLISELDTVKY